MISESKHLSDLLDVAEVGVPRSIRHGALGPDREQLS